MASALEAIPSTEPRRAQLQAMLAAPETIRRPTTDGLTGRKVKTRATPAVVATKLFGAPGEGPVGIENLFRAIENDPVVMAPQVPIGTRLDALLRACYQWNHVTVEHTPLKDTLTMIRTLQHAASSRGTSTGKMMMREIDHFQRWMRVGRGQPQQQEGEALFDHRPAPSAVAAPVVAPESAVVDLGSLEEVHEPLEGPVDDLLLQLAARELSPAADVDEATDSNLVALRNVAEEEELPAVDDCPPVESALTREQMVMMGLIDIDELMNEA
jgi:hypothetical protein